MRATASASLPRRSTPPRWWRTRCACCTCAQPPTVVLRSCCRAWSTRGDAAPPRRHASPRSPPSRRASPAPRWRCLTSPPTPLPRLAGIRSVLHWPQRPTRRPALVRRTSRSRKCTTWPPRWSWTGTNTSDCARPARPRACCAAAPPASAGASRSMPRADSPASARRCLRRRWRRCASSYGSCAAQAGARQVKDARVGITANQGLFGHGSSVLVKR